MNYNIFGVFFYLFEFYKNKNRKKVSHQANIKRPSIRPAIQSCCFFSVYLLYLLQNICLVLSTLMCVKIYWIDPHVTWIFSFELRQQWRATMLCCREIFPVMTPTMTWMMYAQIYYHKLIVPNWSSQSHKLIVTWGMVYKIFIRNPWLNLILIRLGICQESTDV